MGVCPQQAALKSSTAPTRDGRGSATAFDNVVDWFELIGQNSPVTTSIPVRCVSFSWYLIELMQV
jgi:hypothetical protein